MLFICDTPIGHLGFSGDDEALSGLYFCFDDPLTDNDHAPKSVKKGYAEVLEYLSGNRRDFTVALRAEGTPFQQRVWDALSRIPYGETRSYQQIAEEVGSPKGFRAIGQANHHNPISIIVPCHRVIRADGSLGGYGGGLTIKQKLLAMENQ